MAFLKRLDEIGLRDVAACGGKAARLGEAIRLGCPVPPGMVLTTELFQRFMRQGGLHGEVISILTAMQPTTMHQFQAAEWAIYSAFRVRRVPRDVREAIGQAIESLGGLPVAVRSSATSEDSPQQSFVGQHGSYLYVNSEDAAVAAVMGCWMSLYSAKALFYAHRFGVDLLRSSMAVLVQGLVEPTAAGTLFTADPITGSPDVFVLEERQGRREGIHRLDPYEDAPGEATVWQELKRMGLRLDEHLGSYQTVEWAVADGRVQVLRVRPATRVPPYLPVSVRDEDLEGGPLQLAIPKGVEPRRLRPFSWYHRSRSRAARSAFFTRINRQFSVYAGRDDFYLRGYFYYRWRRFAFFAPPQDATSLRLLMPTIWRLALARRLDREFRILSRVRRPRLLELSSIDHSTLTDERLGKVLVEAQGIVETFLEQTGRLGESPQVLAGILRQLHVGWGGSPQEVDDLVYTGADRKSRAERALCEALASADDDTERDEVFADHLHGYRHHYLRDNPVVDASDIATLEFDEAAARAVYKRCLGPSEDTPAARHAARMARREALEEEVLGRLGRIERFVYRQALQVARRYDPLEFDRYEAPLLGFLLERDLLHEVGVRLVERGLAERPEDAALLGSTEITDYLEGESDHAYVERAIGERQVLRRRWQRYGPPPVLGEEPDRGLDIDASAVAPEQVLHGRPACRGSARGRVRIVHTLGEATQVLPGEVLVCPEPLFELSPLFGIVAAVVAESGGLLDHAATLAREYDVPAVFGVEHATERLHNGQEVGVDAVEGLVVPVPVEPEWTEL